MATAGAAIATVLAQALSVIISVLIIRRQKLPFTFRRTDIVFDRKRMGSVFRLGLPIAFQDLLVSISFLAITAIVNLSGSDPFGRRGRGGEAVRIHYAGALGL